MRMNLSWIRPFLIMVVVLALPPVIYWFGYVQNSVLEVKRQGHATLSAVTTEFRERLTAHVGGASGLLRLLPGEDVLVEITPYDTTRGRIVRRKA